MQPPKDAPSNTPQATPVDPSIDPHRSSDLTFTTTPNLLTLSRIIFVPIVVGLLFLKEERWDVVSALLFAVAGATDFFDGYLARKQKSESVYGKLMDPLADKFLVVSCLVMLQYLGRIHPVVVILLICRELAITGLRALASAEGVVIGASQSAKWKTTTQMVAIGCLLAQSGFFGIPLTLPGLVLLYISLGISLWSAKDYIVDFFIALKETRRLKVAERKIAREARHASRAARMRLKAKRHSDTHV